MAETFFVHSACCMKHWILVSHNLLAGHTLVCCNCSKPAGVEVTILDAKISQVLPGTYLSGCCHKPFELVYEPPGQYKLTCENCGQEIEGIELEGPQMDNPHCEICGSDGESDADTD